MSMSLFLSIVYKVKPGDGTGLKDAASADTKEVCGIKKNRILASQILSEEMILKFERF